MKQLVFLGDSITDCDHSFDPGNLGYGYVRMIHKQLNSESETYQIINKGFDGFTLSALRRLWKRDSGTLKKADMLTILIGINDIGVIHNTGADLVSYLAEFKIGYCNFLDEIRASYQGPVILMEPFLFPYPQRYQLRFESLKKMNELIQAIATEYQVSFIPLWDTLLKEASEHGYDALTIDGIHLTEYGHQILTQKWIREYSLTEHITPYT